MKEIKAWKGTQNKQAPQITKGEGGQMELTEEQQIWARKPKHGLAPAQLKNLILSQGGLCALSAVPLRFRPDDNDLCRNGPGVHPLYASLDHTDPGNSKGDFQIICNALNDLKGHLNLELFDALKQTAAWQNLMEQWRKQTAEDSEDRAAYAKLIRPNANNTKLSIGFSDPADRGD